MVVLHTIRSIAMYERKTLMRSWFFRIFSILSLLLLFFMNLMLLVRGGGDTGWAMRSIPSAIPYSNLLIFNVIQAISAVFLTSDFLSRDKNLDTTSVIYMRSMTNGEYVIGKTWGALQIFFILNIAILSMALIFNVLTTGTAIHWRAYAIYPLLISLPTLVFIMGLSFVLMSLIRNQAITFLIVLGYIGTTLFFLQVKYYYLFDYMAFHVPMVISDIAGMGNFTLVLIHRGIYLCFGISFIFFTILLINRLRQSKVMTVFSFISAILFFVAGGYLGYRHISRFKTDEKIRTQAILLNDTYVIEQMPFTRSHTISLHHQGNRVEAESNMILENDTEQSLHQLIFSLNRGLEVNRININGEERSFIRKEHLILVNQGIDILPGESADVEMVYAGHIDETLAYLDIQEEERQKNYGKFAMNVDKRHAFLQPQYVLLTPEVNWYPKTGVTYSSRDMRWYRPEFIDFKLEVKTAPGLNAVSQGRITEISPGHFNITSEVPLTQISLAIGPYAKKVVKRDSMEYGLWHFEGHDFFSPIFTEIKDTILPIIQAKMAVLEQTYNLDYGFDRLFLVEVPAQFKAYERFWINHQEYVQPEQVFIPEKGYLLIEADFKAKKRQWSRQDNKMTDKEMEIRLFTEFIDLFRREKTVEFFVGQYPNPYFIFPMLYAYRNNIHSRQWPVVDRVFESWIKSQSTIRRDDYNLDNQGMSEDDMANMALQEHTFQEILSNPDYKKIIDPVIQLKGEFLFSMIQRKTGAKAFEEFFFKLLHANRFKSISFDQFNQHLRTDFDVELLPVMDSWFQTKTLPAYLLSPFTAVKVKSESRMMTKVSFSVSNTSATEGIIKLSFRLAGGGESGKLVWLEAGQTKDVTLMLHADPVMVKVNTMASKNIPQIIFQRFHKIEEDHRAVVFEGETVSETPVTYRIPGEQIVDNEDPGFSVDVLAEARLFQKWLKRDEKQEKERYATISYWWPSTTWKAVISSGFFGEYARSAYYIKSGDGSLKARWQVPVSNPGYYDLYYHLYKANPLAFEKGQYNFRIFNDRRSEELGLSIESAEDGWNRLGSFYFSGDTVLVELSNQSDIRILFADAVKLVALDEMNQPPGFAFP